VLVFSSCSIGFSVITGESFGKTFPISSGYFEEGGWNMMVLLQHCTWVFPLYYWDWRSVEMVIGWVGVEVGWMVVEVAVVGLVEGQAVVAESMNFVADSAGIVGKGKADMAVEIAVDKAADMIVGKDADMAVGKAVDMAVGKAADIAVGKAADMADFLEYTLANLEKIGVGSAEEAKLAKAWVYSMNFEWEFGNFEEQSFETYVAAKVS
jgi:hypothetical protein